MPGRDVHCRENAPHLTWGEREHAMREWRQSTIRGRSWPVTYQRAEDHRGPCEGATDEKTFAGRAGASSHDLRHTAQTRTATGRPALARESAPARRCASSRFDVAVRVGHRGPTRLGYASQRFDARARAPSIQG